jgi:hypothetical protein
VALSLDPRLLEAIELKEEITQTSYTVDAVRVSAVEGVVQQLILDDLQRGTPATPSGTTSDGVETVTIGIRPVGGVGSTEEEEQSQGAAAEDANASALPAESTLPDEVVFPSR